MKKWLFNTLATSSILLCSASGSGISGTGESGKVDGKSANRPAASVVGGALESALPPSMRCGECPELPLDSTKMCVFDLAVCPNGRGYYVELVPVKP